MLAAISNIQRDIRLIETKSKQYNTTVRVARLVSRMFKKQASSVVNRFKKNHKLTEVRLLEDKKDELDTVGASYSTQIEQLLKTMYLTSAMELDKKFQTGISFNLKNPRAVKYFKNYGTTLVKNINEETRSRIKTLIENGLDNGHSYDRIARDMRSMFNDWSQLTPKEKSALRTRTQLIAVTETGNAYQQGNIDLVRSAMDNGLKFQKSWLTVGDGKVDPHCKANEDQGWIDVDETFSSGVDRPLDHPGCRCSTLFRRST